MVVVKAKKIDRELHSQLYGRNRLFTAKIDMDNNDINVTINDINTKLNALMVKGYRGLYKYGLSIINRELNAGGQSKYRDDEERRIAHNQQSLSSYHNNPDRVKYKMDTDKSASINSKNKIVEATKQFYSQHYQFNYFISLQHGFILDKGDKNKAKTSTDYLQLRQQDKYQIARTSNLGNCIQQTEKYIESLIKNGNPIFDNYYYTIHRSHYDNSYHSHIAINIVDGTIKNVYTYLQNRWHLSKRKKQMVKKIHNSAELIGYMNEEKKRLNGEPVYTQCNINRHSNRLVTQSDLVDNIDYSLATYNHPTTQNKLLQYGISKRG